MIFYLFQFMANKVMILHYKTKTQYSNTKEKEKEIYGTIGDLQWNQGMGTWKTLVWKTSRDVQRFMVFFSMIVLSGC